MQLPPWTYSQLEAFETCPRQYYEVRVKRSVPYVQNDAAKWGDEVHQAFELRVGQDKPLPTGMAQWEPLVKRLVALPGEKIVEGKFAIDKDFNACDYYAKDAWSRGKIDLSVISTRTAAIIDYKTGKRKPSEQLELYSGYVFRAYPKLETIHTSFIWLKEKKIDKATINRGEMPVIWQGFLSRYRRIEIAHEKDSWPARPSGLCKKYCPIKTCEFNGV